jgi:hypothetical protein
MTQFWARHIPSAVSRPHRPIVVLGMWLVFGPLFAGTLGYAGWFVMTDVPMFCSGHFSIPDLAFSSVGLLANLFGMFVTGRILFKTLGNYRRLSAAERVTTTNADQ